MIPYSFDYYRPNSISEAIETYDALNLAGKTPVYYSGGSEIISMARVNTLSMKAVIDLKEIPECICQKISENRLILGSSLTLASITEPNHFPLLSKSCGRIADHTMQCKITLGGNICGTIIYKEALLPLLLSDASVVIASKDKLLTVPLHDIYNHKLNLKKGDFLVQFIIEGKYLSLPYFHIKKTKNEKIDYPLLTLAALLYEGQVRLAFSGLCEYPFRSKRMEEAWNESELQPEARIHELINKLPGPVLNDISGSDQYRLFVLKTTLQNLERALEENTCLK